MSSSILARISFWTFFLTITLLPIFLIPFSPLAASAAKAPLLVFGIGVSAIAWLLARIVDGHIYIPRSGIMLAVSGVVLTTFLSARFSASEPFASYGLSMDVGTFWFIFSVFVVSVMAALVVNTHTRVAALAKGILVSLFALASFQMLRFGSPAELSLGVLGGRADTLVDSWNAFGLLCGLAVVLSVYALEFHMLRQRTALYTLLFVALFGCLAVNSPLVWKLVGVLALIIFIYRIVTKGDNKSPTLSFSVVVASLLFFFMGSLIGSWLPSSIGVVNFEVLPSTRATLDIGREVLNQSPWVGVGPNNFAEAWAQWKPVSVNSSQFWDTDFTSGSGFIITHALMTGWLGVLAWVVLLALVFARAVKSVFGGSSEYYPIKNFYLLGGVFMLACSYLYPVGYVGIVLCFVMLGVFAGITSREEGSVLHFEFLTDPRKSFFVILLLMVLAAGVGKAVFEFSKRFSSVGYFSQSDIVGTDSVQILNKAVSLYQTDVYFRALSKAHLTRLQELSQQDRVDQGAIESALNGAIDNANNAIDYNPKNYLNYVSLANVYSELAVLDVLGASEQAIAAYEQASMLNPNHPGIRLAIANEHLSAGDTEQAESVAMSAVALAPRYMDALQLLVNIESKLGNTEQSEYYAKQVQILSPEMNTIEDNNAEQ